MENMKQQGTALTIGNVDHWMDCGNKDATIDTNTQILKLTAQQQGLVSTNIEKVNSVVIEPCYIGEGVVLHDSVVGPYASIGAGTTIKQSVIKESMVFNQALVSDAVLRRAMIGNYAAFQGQPAAHNIGDYSSLNY